MEKDFDQEVDRWVGDNWEKIVSDIDALVRIESTEDLPAACENAPFGAGPRASLSKALDIADAMGFSTQDVDGYMGFAELPGKTSKQLGIIGHTDVVPAGPGWHFPPFEVTRKDGYLVGRGVIDDKGPLVCALHAMRFFLERGEQLPATVRILFGANEECGMKDVPYYRERYADPDFLFTPDAEFPVCYGEKGNFAGAVVSCLLEEPAIVEIAGGTVTNAVPGLAHAVVRFPGGDDAFGMLIASEGVVATLLDADAAAALGLDGQRLLRVDATGRSAHASTPEKGLNADGLLFAYLMRNNLLSAQEREFAELAMRLIDDWRGAGWGLACEDADFGPLTIIGSVLSLRDGRLRLVFDCRYPTSTTFDKLHGLISSQVAKHHATLEVDHTAIPFVVDAQAPEVQALIAVYNEVTGESAEPFTMGGGTYARHFSRAVSFGPEKPWVEVPAWAGGMHGPDEAVSEALLKQATTIYIHAIKRLCETIA